MAKNKVIGLGLGRTGTSTLGMACELLGYRLKENDFELLKQVRLSIVEPSLKVAENYDCLEDFPWQLIYKELYERFPNTKFILTVRKNVDIWMKSYIYQAIRGKFEVRKAITKRYPYEFGTPYPIGYENEWKSIYLAHNKEIREFFKDKDNFIELCWEKGHGWKELCDFIDEDVPNLPFPCRKPGYPYPNYDRLYRMAKNNTKKFFGMV